MATVFCRHLCLCQCPGAGLKFLWTEGHDKLGVGVTQESHKIHGMSFPWETRVPLSTGKGRQTEMKDKAVRLWRGHVSKSMSTAFSGDKRCVLTS
jgi:hypothetical protein